MTSKSIDWDMVLSAAIRENRKWEAERKSRYIESGKQHLPTQSLSWGEALGLSIMQTCIFIAPAIGIATTIAVVAGFIGSGTGVLRPILRTAVRLQTVNVFAFKLGWKLAFG